MPPSAQTATARIEVFRPGTFTPMGGSSLSFSAAHLKAAADAYDFATAPAPLVVGHPATEAPAYGWVQSFEFDASTERLYANVGEIDPAFSEAVKAGRYKKVSLSFFRPESSNNPVPGTWYPKHVGFLGGVAPAVAGLRNVSFSAPSAADATFEAAFGETGFEETAGLFRLFREWLIEKFGMEDADKALPSYRIEWLDSMELDASRQTRFAAPTPPNPNPEKKELAVTLPDPAFAAREANVTTREAALAAREAVINQTENASFAETLVTEGRLLPVMKDKVIAILNVLPGHASVSFSEGGEKLSPVAALKSVLSDLPKVVNFGKADLPELGKVATASFASDGKEVDPAQLEIHAKALDHMRKTPGTPYIDAVRAVS